jgi:hypothetical protein
MTFPDSWDDKPTLGGRCQGSLTAKRRPPQRTALTPAGPRLRCCYGECQLGSGLHAHPESLTDLVFVGRPLLEGLLDDL